ncbi:phosphonate-transporting ATPase [Pseudomonas sp. BAY1663]|nr:phosphonate-transporting ATPase [Pseudomonas sp. BAY1663]
MLRLRYGGHGAAPDLLSLGDALGGRVSLIEGSIERIQGRPLGRLVLEVAGSPLEPEDLLVNARRLADHAEVLGYVATAA